MQRACGLLSLGISPGDNITIITEGRDESIALSELEALRITEWWINICLFKAG